jgi:hypothetical protein
LKFQNKVLHDEKQKMTGVYNKHGKAYHDITSSEV